MSEVIDLNSPAHRHRLLELAVGHHGHMGTADEVLATANSFHGFVSGEQKAATPTRGRPRKETSAALGAPAAPAQTAPAAEPDIDTDTDTDGEGGFLDDVEPPAAVETLKIEDVRAALLALQQRSDAKTARALLMKESGGADTLGKVKPESFAKIIKAAKDWKKAA